jgi:hypothetical protein
MPTKIDFLLVKELAILYQLQLILPNAGFCNSCISVLTILNLGFEYQNACLVLLV